MATQNCPINIDRALELALSDLDGLQSTLEDLLDQAYDAGHKEGYDEGKESCD
jgi:hypothetical protein